MQRTADDEATKQIDVERTDRTWARYGNEIAYVFIPATRSLPRVGGLSLCS
jgi:hypothetical protein